MFKKILIANRGEIACRVIRTARAMGIKTVAVHSEADADARHVREADEAVAIGPSPSAQSYLVPENILRAARETGAEAIHPGYGFLSEKADFAAAVEKAGLAFIGPSPAAIAAMGDKIESKKLAEKAGVNGVPGHLKPIKDQAEAVQVARGIGYPVMIKASAGGGGKGMRLAYNDGQAGEGFISASNEARSSFADDRVFIEKFIERPRHIEIQVLGDAHGHVIHLGERECSIQRRHQKVIEEAPSPFLDPRTRAAMGEQAVALAKAVGYRSAGTVEFIVDPNRKFYFLEMNTRLQVEHPVTEMVTGLDLVEWMIRIAAGEKLTVKQSEVRARGWAMEARVYAEDPARGFLPSIGRLTRYREPIGAGARTDSGVYEGAEIAIFYDPMIAKLATHGADRPAAIAAMREALDEFCIRGVTTNIPFLSAVMGHPRFQAGDISTGFIAEEFPDGFKGAAPTPERLGAIAAVAAVCHHRLQARGGTGRNGDGGGDWVVVKNGERIKVTVAETAAGHAAIGDFGSLEVVGEWRFGEPIFRGTINDRPLAVQIEQRGIGYRLVHDGLEAELQVMTPRAAELAALMPEKRRPDTSRFVLSPMPGLLSSLAVTVAEEVKAGQALAVIEAMKMENVLRAERDGRVVALLAASGDSLATDQPIIEFEWA